MQLAAWKGPTSVRRTSRLLLRSVVATKSLTYPSSFCSKPGSCRTVLEQPQSHPLSALVPILFPKALFCSQIQQIMEDAGLEADIDRVANVRGRVRGRRSDAPVLLSGSHYDTVKDGGRFDGMLGIIVPIAAVKALLVQVYSVSLQAMKSQGHTQIQITCPTAFFPSVSAYMVLKAQAAAASPLQLQPAEPDFSAICRLRLRLGRWMRSRF